MTPSMSPIPDGMRAAEARVTSLQTLLGMRPSAASGAAFASVLAAQGSESVAPMAAAGLGSTGERAVVLAAQQEGTPYVWGGGDPKTGFDCSGLVQYVYGQLGVSLPRNTVDQAQAGTAVASIA